MVAREGQCATCGGDGTQVRIADDFPQPLSDSASHRVLSNRSRFRLDEPHALEREEGVKVCPCIDQQRSSRPDRADQCTAETGTGHHRRCFARVPFLVPFGKILLLQECCRHCLGGDLKKNREGSDSNCRPNEKWHRKKVLPVGDRDQQQQHKTQQISHSHDRQTPIAIDPDTSKKTQYEQRSFLSECNQPDFDRRRIQRQRRDQRQRKPRY